MKRLQFAGLSGEEKWRVVASVARRENGRLDEWGPNVVGVSPGYRKRERSRRLYRQPCVSFTVLRKRKRLSSADFRIPRFLPARLQRGSKYVQVRVPTDVTSVEGGREQNGNDLCARRSGRDECLPGAATCLVLDEFDNLYIMGCHHVLAFSSQMPFGRGVHRVDISQGAHPLGFRDIDAPFPEIGGYAVDASLAFVPPGNHAIARMLLFPGGFPSVLRNRFFLPPGTGVRILSPRGTLSGMVVKRDRPAVLPYNRGAYYVRFSEAYQLHVNVPDVTRGGDSGSPVVLEQGTLVGMHFWGWEQQQRSYMLPTSLLFSDETFGRRIRLVA
jgi:hypothetical protein